MSSNRKSSAPAFGDLRNTFEQLSKPQNISSPPTPKPTDNTANTMFLPKPNDSVRSKASIAEVLNTAVQPAATLLNSLQSTSPLAKQPGPAPTSPAPAPTPVNTPGGPSSAPQTVASSTGDPVHVPAPAALPVTTPQPDITGATASSVPSPPTIVTPVSPAPIPPALPTFSQRPSWIGPPRPDRPVTPGLPSMKQPVVVEYASKGLQPPVYVFTSLSDPQWNAVEMDSEKKDDGEYRFYKAFQAEEGEYQYKFRLGPGDWWASDESKPLVDDGQGNKNNQLVVKSVSAQPQPVQAKQAGMQQQGNLQGTSASQATQSPALLPAELSKPVEAVQGAVQPVAETLKKQAAPVVDQLTQSTVPVASKEPQSTVAPVAEAAPLLPHEKDSSTTQPVQRPTDVALPGVDAADPPFATPTAETPAAAPLMKHETFFAEEKSAADNGDVPPQWEANDADIEPAMNDEDDDTDADEDDDEPDEHTSPLLRHESLGPDTEHHAPLMRHETAGIGEHHDDEDVFSSTKASSTSSAEDSIAPEADPNDPTLEKFPTSKKDILDHIHRVSSGKHMDETLEHAHRGPVVVDELGSPISSLASVREDQEEDEPNPPKIRLTEAAGPITPPLTPQELDTFVQPAEDRAKAEEVEELMAERIIERQKEAAAEEKQEKVIAEMVQERGLFGMLMDVAANPLTIFAIAGIALAVAAGYWKLRYAPGTH